MTGRTARPVRPSDTSQQMLTPTGSYGRGYGSSLRSVRVGVTGVRTSRPPRPVTCATSSGFTVCGVRKACVCPPQAS